MEVQRISRPTLICRICGDVARGMNFGVITCMSCKAFFRRHALRPKGSFHCTRKFQCEIAKETRHNCAVCRLNKCLVFGMKPQLIRAFPRYQLPALQPLDLLQNDRSTLTEDQWNLISNIHHIYDKNDPLSQIKRLWNEKSSLPVKFRGKASFALDFIQQFFLSLEPIIKGSPDIQSLSADARGTLMARNILSLASLNSVLIHRGIHYSTDPNFTMSMSGMCGSDVLKGIHNHIARVDLDEIAVKMMLFVMTFLSNSSPVQYDPADDMNMIAAPIDAIRMQDLYVTVLWKYLLHRCGFMGAVRRYCSCIKATLDVHWIHEKLRENELYDKMVDVTVKDIEYSLVIEE